MIESCDCGEETCGGNGFVTVMCVLLTKRLLRKLKGKTQAAQADRSQFLRCACSVSAAALAQTCGDIFEEVYSVACGIFTAVNCMGYVATL